LHAAVRAAVDRLPEGQRLVVVLADFQGLPYREVAEILDIPVGTVKSRRFAADKRLREMLNNLGEAK
jgi:RNA polymerase sigma-70 factor (ECF subfamily)